MEIQKEWGIYWCVCVLFGYPYMYSMYCNYSKTFFGLLLLQYCILYALPTTLYNSYYNHVQYTMVLLLFITGMYTPTASCLHHIYHTLGCILYVSCWATLMT